MSDAPQRPVRAALTVALLCAGGILLLQLLAVAIPSLGGAIRHLPLLPVALVLITAVVMIQLVRAR